MLNAEDQVTPLQQARLRDVARRHDRVREAVASMLRDGSEITISSVAARAAVHRSFIHRHTALHAEVLRAADNPTPGSTGTMPSRRSILADNANLRETTRRLSQRVADLEHRLSELLGEQVFARTGLGASPSHAALQEQISTLEQRILDQQQTLQDREEELAAREAHRRLMAQANRSSIEGKA